MTTRAERIAEIRERVEKAEVDVAFIAHVGQDVFWLLDEVERLEGQLRVILPEKLAEAAINGQIIVRTNK